jgi:hypothetical protein
LSPKILFKKKIYPCLATLKISFQPGISGKGNLNLKLEHPLHSEGGTDRQLRERITHSKRKKKRFRV